MKLKELASTKKGQLVICCVVLALVWGFLLIRFGVSYLGDLPDEKKISNAKKELDKITREYEKAQEASKETQETRRRYRQLASTAWLTDIDGRVETALRRKISKISEEQDFKLNSIGSVRMGRINPEFTYADIDIQGSGDIEDVITFLAGLANIQPRLAWRRLDLRPDLRYRRSTGAGSANLAAQLNTVPATRLNFNGSLRVLVYEGELTAKDLNIKREKFVEMPAEAEYEMPAAEGAALPDSPAAVPAGGAK